MEVVVLVQSEAMAICPMCRKQRHDECYGDPTCAPCYCACETSLREMPRIGWPDLFVLVCS